MPSYPQLGVSCVDGFNIKQDVGADAEERRRRLEPTPIALRAIVLSRSEPSVALVRLILRVHGRGSVA